MLVVLYISGADPRFFARGQGHRDHRVRNQYIWFRIFVQIPQCIYDTGGERWGVEGVLVNHMPAGIETDVAGFSHTPIRHAAE